MIPFELGQDGVLKRDLAALQLTSLLALSSAGSRIYFAFVVSPNDQITDCAPSVTSEGPTSVAGLSFGAPSGWAPPCSRFVLTTTVPAIKSCRAHLFWFVSIVSTSARNHKPGSALRSQNGSPDPSASPFATALRVTLPARMEYT